ncbi:MAG: type II secretion system minor pseudopilin GspI [Gammaproteobacteria bacterium]|nr:type II secretion system minor pseudopilin GspI [Gammaproteobacteria bacterium]
MMSAKGTKPNVTHTSGFTLLEVLVAMAILAITLGTLIKTVGGYAENASYLKERTLAQWIAENKAAEYQLKKEFPAPGRTEGEIDMANQQWQWQVKISTTQDARLRRLDISVYTDSGDADNPISKLVTFIGKPL